MGSADVIARPDLERLVIANGATVSANPSGFTSVLVSTGKDNAKVRNWARACEESPDVMSQKYPALDVVSHVWVQECVARQQVLPFAPRHMLYASPTLRAKFAFALDPFEDPYFEDATFDSFTKSLEKAREPSTVAISNSELAR